MAKPRLITPAERAFNEALGERIRYEREEAGLSIVDLAKELHTTPSILSSIEAAGGRPHAYMLFQMCEIFRIDMDSMCFEAKQARDAVGGRHG